MTMMVGFIGIQSEGRHILLNINRIISIDGAEDGVGGCVITYQVGNETRLYPLPDVPVAAIANGLAQAAQSGIAMPKAMVEAFLERTEKGELDS